MKYHVLVLLCLLMGLAVAGCASMDPVPLGDQHVCRDSCTNGGAVLQSLRQVVRQRKHGVPVMDRLRVLLCLVVVLMGRVALAAGPRCDEAKQASASAASRCAAASQQCQRTKAPADCARSASACEAAQALAEKAADVCSTTEAAADAPRMCAVPFTMKGA